MGGVAALHRAGVETFAFAKTNEAAPGRGLVPTRRSLPFKADVEVLAGGALEAFYPGAGHTADNIVVYVKPAAVLFGGCLVRPNESNGLGNTADADVGHWDAAVAAVKARYPDARIVVPSHGAPGAPAMLDHTISVVTEKRAQPANQ
jgi:glyoxylase-like metal-dependent hydrolase (beta-lactamase superfamily II)